MVALDISGRVIGRPPAHHATGRCAAHLSNGKGQAAVTSRDHATNRQLIGHGADEGPGARSDVHGIKIRIIIRTEQHAGTWRVAHREALRNRSRIDRCHRLGIDVDAFEDSRGRTGSAARGMVEKSVRVKDYRFATIPIYQSKEKGLLGRGRIDREKALWIGS